LRVRDEARGDHVLEHLLRARGGACAVARRAEARGRSQKARDDRRLVERHVARGLVEIASRRRVDAVGTGAQIDAVQVDLQDLVLGEAVLQPERQQHFLDLAAESPLGLQEQVLGELLGDRAAALHDVARPEVRHGGAQEPDGIDAEVVIEPPVLGRDHRLRQVLRHFLDVDRLAEQVAVCRDERAVEGEHGDAGPALRNREVGGAGQRQREISQHQRQQDDAPEPRDQAATQDDARDRAAAFLGRARLALARLRRRLARAVVGVDVEISGAASGHGQERGASSTVARLAAGVTTCPLSRAAP
jgi:hypothetical protein